MEASPQLMLISVGIYAIGFVGLFGVTLLPLRAAALLRRNADLWHLSTEGKFALGLVALCAAVAIILAAVNVAGVFRCLTGSHCGSNRASGWFFLVVVGLLYSAFEIISWGVIRVTRWVAHVAT